MFLYTYYCFTCIHYRISFSESGKSFEFDLPAETGTELPSMLVQIVVRWVSCATASGDEEARHRGTQKSILERKGPATFPVVIEMRERALWVSHWTEESVDLMLLGQDPLVQARSYLPFLLPPLLDLTFTSISANLPAISFGQHCKSTSRRFASHGLIE